MIDIISFISNTFSPRKCIDFKLISGNRYLLLEKSNKHYKFIQSSYILPMHYCEKSRSFFQVIFQVILLSFNLSKGNLRLIVGF